jgi:hypothetical protein
MATRGYINADATNPKGEYRKPFVVVVPILDRRDGYYVRPNKVVI